MHVYCGELLDIAGSITNGTLITERIADLLAEHTPETIEITKAARDWLAKRGFDPDMGARPLASTIQEHVKKPLADQILFGTLKDGGHAEVDYVDGEIVVRAREVDIAPVTEEEPKEDAAEE